MRFRPCIDIHNGKVKQIVGGTLHDEGDRASENFVSEKGAADYARLYRREGLSGGHIIVLNHRDSAYYEESVRQAKEALSAWPQAMQIGGGITPENAEEYLEAGASHVIVTSYVFSDGRMSAENLERMKAAAGRERLVLDLSCRRKNDAWYIVTDRWQKFTDQVLSPELIRELSAYCDEFLVHAADVEGRSAGVEKGVAGILRRAAQELEKAYPERAAEKERNFLTYAGGIGSFEDLDWIGREGGGKIDVTIGSALDLFGGKMAFEQVLDTCRKWS